MPGNLIYYALVLIVIALVAALLGFGGVASTAMGGAHLLIWVAAIVLIIGVVFALIRRTYRSVAAEEQQAKLGSGSLHIAIERRERQRPSVRELDISGVIDRQEEPVGEFERGGPGARIRLRVDDDVEVAKIGQRRTGGIHRRSFRGERPRSGYSQLPGATAKEQTRLAPQPR